MIKITGNLIEALDISSVEEDIYIKRLEDCVRSLIASKYYSEDKGIPTITFKEILEVIAPTLRKPEHLAYITVQLTSFHERSIKEYQVFAETVIGDLEDDLTGVYGNRAKALEKVNIASVANRYLDEVLSEENQEK